MTIIQKFFLDDPQLFDVTKIAAVDKLVKMNDYGGPCKTSVDLVCQAYTLEADFVEEIYWTLQSRKPSKILSPTVNDLIFDVYLRPLTLADGATFPPMPPSDNIEAVDEVVGVSSNDTKKPPTSKPGLFQALVRIAFMSFATCIFIYWWPNQNNTLGAFELLHNVNHGSYPSKTDEVAYGCRGGPTGGSFPAETGGIFAIADSECFNGPINVTNGLCELMG